MTKLAAEVAVLRRRNAWAATAFAAIRQMAGDDPDAGLLSEKVAQIADRARLILGGGAQPDEAIGHAMELYLALKNVAEYGQPVYGQLAETAFYEAEQLLARLKGHYDREG